MVSIISTGRHALHGLLSFSVMFEFVTDSMCTCKAKLITLVSDNKIDMTTQEEHYIVTFVV